MNEPKKLTVGPGKCAWCTCLLSKNFPFCGGSHITTDKTPVIETIEKETDKFICTCRKTGNAPFCDGSHLKETDQETPQLNG